MGAPTRELLFLTQRIPYPPIKGEKIRPLQILRHLRQTFLVHLGCLVDDDSDWQHLGILRELCGETYFAPLNPRVAKVTCLRGLAGRRPLSVPYFHHRGLARWVRDLLARRRPAAVFVCSSAMAQYVGRAEALPRASVIDFADVDSDKWRQYAETRPWPMSWVYRRESRTLLDFDRGVAGRFRASTFVSAAEAGLFRRVAPEVAAKVHHVDSGVDHEYFSPAPEHPRPFPAGGPALVFTGTMSYWPNADAVSWFAHEVLPDLRRARGDIRFFIVGSSPTEKVRRLAKLPGVFVTGRVPDVRPYLAHAAMVVAPLRVANGVQNKVLEAMAMSRLVIASRRALGGVSVEPGRDLIAAETAAEFARAIVEHLAAGDAPAFGARARARVLERYDWSRNLQAFDRLLDAR